MGMGWGRGLFVAAGALCVMAALMARPVGAQGFSPCEADQKVAEAFTTESYQVWICMGDGSLTYNALNGEGDGIVLPATADGRGGYDASEGQTQYHIDPQHLVVTDATGVIADQPVTTTPAAGDPSSAPTSTSEDGGEVGVVLLVTVVGLLLVLLFALPVIVALGRGVGGPHLLKVILATLFFFSWPIALFWAFTSITREQERW